MFLAEISPEASSFYTKLILSYLKGDKQLESLYTYPHQASSFEQVVANRKFDAHSREVLHKVLLEQYEPIGLAKNALVLKNIELLKDENTFTVTTGHQLCIATGPAYFISKIAHVIKTCQELSKQFPDKHFVPVFWMASEDHDFEEIQSIQVNGQKVTWNHPNTTHHVGSYDLNGMDLFFDDLRKVVGHNQQSQIISSLEKIYLSSKTLSEATFKVVHGLFQEYGLVVIEPNQKQLKELLKPVMKKDVFDQVTIDALTTTGNYFTELKHKQQISGRNINFFYLSDQGRILIHKIGDTYKLGDEGNELSESEMLSAIEQYPERFSPNVALRPVYQELILPNIAYVGGPGEVAYWLQLKGVFAAHQVAYPMVLVRNSFAILTTKTKHYRIKVGIADDIYFGRRDRINVEVLNKLIPTNEASIQVSIGNYYQQLIDEVSRFDNQLGSKIINQKVMTDDFFESLKKQIRKSKAAIEKHQLEMVDAIRNELFIGDTPAERVSNILSYTSEGDVKTFIQEIINHTEPITKGVKLIAY